MISHKRQLFIIYINILNVQLKSCDYIDITTDISH